tara:strand:- start:67 stop:711 length:645 start_codon:yes stop_codon:yes gene_type:complete
MGGKNTFGAFGIASTIAGLGADIVLGISANKAAKEAEKKAEAGRERLRALENSRQDLINPYEDLTNQFANLSVATKASEFQAEETDIALANTLDTIRATGGGAGGATALAQAALKGKRDISANLEAQQTANEQKRAEGAATLQEQKAEGEKWKWQMKEDRDISKLNRAQFEIDQASMQQMQYKTDAATAFGGIAGTLTTGFENILAGFEMDKLG